MSILSARAITKAFLFRGELSTILKSINFDLHEGEFVSIVGSSGCGKTTLLELLAGITLPDSGSIRYLGSDITGKTGYLGYMPQDDMLFPWLKVMDNLLLPARIRGRDVRLERKKALDLLPVFGLESHADYHPWQLSGGLRQRVALARTYMTGSKVWLLDEPLANLDAITRSALQDWILAIVHKLNLSVLMVTHDIEEALKLSDRVEVMKAGVFQGSLLVSDKQNERVMKEHSLRVHELL